MSEQEYNKNAPTKKILEYAQDISKKLKIALPKECEDDFKACCLFVDKHKPLLPPSESQLRAIYATEKRLKIKAPNNVRELATEAFKFLQEHNKKD